MLAFHGSDGATARSGSRWLRVFIVLALMSSPISAGARADDYSPQRAGHPVRMVAYALSPVGVVLDWVFFRPVYWIGGHEPFRTLFGRDLEDRR